ncbi:hypothetical protein LTR08_008012 [Meristemomyces frigidus]|nr:hypothetical protein LTR08_008012 [Meristemomyces frigidus]
MLSRPPTKITLTPEDILAYEQRKLSRDAVREQHMHSSPSQDTSGSTIENGDTSIEQDVSQDLTPAQQTRAARMQKTRLDREARMGIGGGGGSRG